MPLATTLREKGTRVEDILNLFGKSPADDSAVVARFEALAGVARARRLGVRAAALKRGVNLEGVKQRDDELEVLTGRRGSPE